MSKTITSPTRSRPRQRSQRTARLRYTSPRCQFSNDDDFLPTEALENTEDRWKHMSQQAGDHQQDGSVLDLTSRQSTCPASLKMGVPPRVALRVKQLHLDIAGDLPEWLDVVSSLFFSLQHFYTTTSAIYQSNTECARMRRLYILYRLPDLVSIDGRPVTELERQLARPSSPNGYRVKREDWIVVDSSGESSQDSGDEDDLLEHGDAVEVNLFGVVKRVNADPPKEEWDEPELQKPYQPADCSSSPRVSVTKSVETVYRTMNKKDENAKSYYGLAAAFADGNPCVGGRRHKASLDEPHTIDYPTTGSPVVTTPKSQPQSPPMVTSPKGQERAPPVITTPKAQQERAPLATEVRTPPSKSPKQQPASPKQQPASTSLSSPFPMQFRSKSFNGALPNSSRRNGLKREKSSPELQKKVLSEKKTIDSASSSPMRNALQREVSSPELQKRTMRNNLQREMSSPELSSGKTSLRPKQSPRRSERPPPCPGARRIVPVEKIKKLSRWRSKKSIRATSIVDTEEEDDEDSIEEEEEEEELVRK